MWGGGHTWQQTQTPLPEPAAPEGPGGLLGAIPAVRGRLPADTTPLALRKRAQPGPPQRSQPPATVSRDQARGSESALPTPSIQCARPLHAGASS